jgi:LysR family transcriptional regulator, nod-box dependent transcriptional activator
VRNLRSANLNLLPILRVLLRHQHVTHAARALNMSQSSVSEALSNLRHLFNDELLVPHGNQLVLTALAQRLEPLIEKSLDSVVAIMPEEMLAWTQPKSAIDVSATDYLVLTIGTQVVNRVREERPGLAVRFHDHDDRCPARLRSGDLDFMIRPEVTVASMDSQFGRELIYEDRIVCLVDEASHIKERVSEEQYRASRHVFFSPRTDVYDAHQTTILQQIGEKRPDATLVQSYLLLPFFVEGSDFIALVQYQLAQKLLPAARVRVVEAPFDIKVRIFAFWDAVRAQDPLQSWFLGLLRDIFNSQPAVHRGPDEPLQVTTRR